jgi:hypothetical protein
MKPEERHELKTNELAEWIANFPEWAKENVLTIVLGAVVIVMVFYMGYKWTHRGYAISREQIEMSQLAGQLEMTKMRMVSAKGQTPANPEMLRSMADRLDTLSGQLSQPEYAAFALIKRGEALRAELHFGAADFAKDPNALEFQVNKAKTCYRQAIEKASADSELAAMAQFGLGLCEEELSNFEAAQKIYHDIAKNEKYAGMVVLSMARERAADMADYKGPFAFVATPKAPSVQSAPAMPLGPRIENAPPQAPTAAPAVKSESNAPAAK